MTGEALFAFSLEVIKSIAVGELCATPTVIGEKITDPGRFKTKVENCDPSSGQILFSR